MELYTMIGDNGFAISMVLALSDEDKGKQPDLEAVEGVTTNQSTRSTLVLRGVEQGIWKLGRWIRWS